MPFEQCIGSRGLFPEEKSSIGKIIRIYNKKEPLTIAEKKILKDGYCYASADELQISLAVPIGKPNVIAGLALAGYKEDFDHVINFDRLVVAAKKINATLIQ